MTGSEGGVKFDFLCILPRNLSSNRGKHRADFKERGASSLGSSLKQRGLSGTWSKLNTNNQTQTALRGGFCLKRRIYGLEAPSVAMTVLSGSGVWSSFISGYTIILPLETGRAGTKVIGQSINFI